MSRTLASTPIGPLLRRSELPEKAVATAKAQVRIPDQKQLTWVDLAWCLERVRYELQLNHDEFSRLLGRDPSQVAKMLKAEDRPQIELCWPHDHLRRELIVAMAKRGGGMDVVTTISVRRTA